MIRESPIVEIEAKPHQVELPIIIKYMGSKKPILNFIVSNLQKIHDQENLVCDLFAGSCSISAALRNQYNFLSNDIQDYSRVIGQTYFSDYSNRNVVKLLNEISAIASVHKDDLLIRFEDFVFDYSVVDTLEEYSRIEGRQRELLEAKLANDDYDLFTRFYSGTYWSCEQCIWIDSLRKAADEFIDDQPLYNVILSSIMFAMSNTTQSTGHFAQYRDGLTEDAMLNILVYRQKNFIISFKKKLTELLLTLTEPVKEIITTTSDFADCLKTIRKRTTVYADPPYAPVHYSRFYHALETLVKYDYPAIEFKGRYRTDRHQSPFSQKTKAIDAFEDLFDGIVEKQAQMLLSYSNNGVIEIEQITELARQKFKGNYMIDLQQFDHIHSTMGKAEDARRDVVEHLIIAKLR